MNAKTWLAMLPAAALALAFSDPAFAGNRCLEFSKIKLTHMVSPTEMDVTTLRNDRFRVRFAGACRVGGTYSWNHFEYTDLLVGKCMNARDVLPTSSLGPCVVDSVTPLERPAG
jgi:hypothetical protein